MSDPQVAAEEGRTETDDPKQAEGAEEENGKEEKESVPDADTAALIGKIAEQFTPKPTEDLELDDTDDELDPPVNVDEVEVEQVKHDKPFMARVERIAKQAEFVYNEEGLRRDTLFYKIVLAGNVRVVSHVLDHLHEKEKSDVADWLLMKGKNNRISMIPVQGVKVLKMIQLFMYLVFTFACIISSPFFYLLHSFTTHLFGQQKHRLAANIRLPLAFASFSQDEDMMKFFLSKGVSIKKSDREGNNVFHYIADLSSESTDRAMEVFTCLVKFINDKDVVKLLIGEKRNSAGLTALEYAAKYGSPQLLTQMLNYPGLVQHTAFAAGKEDVTFGQTETEEDHNDDPVDPITKLEYVDVTMYEAGGFTRLSTLLNLLSDREITDMSKEDLGLFNRVAFVGKWIALKTKQMFLGVVCFSVGDLTVTVFLIILLINGLGSDPYMARESNAELEVMLKEIRAQSSNKSYIFRDEALDTVFENVQYDLQLNFLERKVLERKEKLFQTATRLYPDVRDFYNNSQENFDLSANNTPSWLLDKLYESAMEMEDFRPMWPMFYMRRYLHEIIESYSKELFVKNPHLSNCEVDIANREFIEGELEDFFKNFTLIIDDYSFVPSATFDFWEFQNVFCVKKQLFKEKDLKDTAYIQPPSQVYYSSCSYQALMELANQQCESISPEEIYDMVQVIGMKRGSMGSNEAEVVFQVIVAFAYLYIFLDIVERMVFIYTCVAHHTNAKEMILSVLSKKVPGSYTKKQINMVTYFAFILRAYLVSNGPAMARSYGWTMDEVKEYGNFFMVIGLVFRFVMHIHALRLFPGIGHFVITTFMMGTNLIHFSAVYGAVVFIFSIIFHILIEDPECPLKKYDGFTSILASMFSIFKLTFGHGEFDAYYTTTPVMLTYTLYTIIVGLLLMNLIIAIMSTTATDIMTDPWKETLWRIEWLDEALSVEFTFNLFAQALKRWCHNGFWTHKKAGFVVFKVGKEKADARIFIEVFHCRALEKD